MVRHSRAAGLDEQAGARARLDAMRLHPAGSGWVPEPVSPVESSPPPPAPLPVLAQPPPPGIGELARAWVIDRSPPWAHGAVERLRFGPLIMALALLATVIVAGVLVLHRGSGGGYPAPYDPPAVSSAVAASPEVSAAPGTDATSIVVDVGGRVRKPGLVTLPSGARVADAIAAAGGPLHHREIATLDLAARVSDGQLLLVGVNAAPVAGGASGGSAGSSTGGPPVPVDLDAATIDELETLPGVGPVTAQKIIDWRTAHDGFTAVSQLQQVPGIGPARFAELSPLVTP